MMQDHAPAQERLVDGSIIHTRSLEAHKEDLIAVGFLTRIE